MHPPARIALRIMDRPLKLIADFRLRIGNGRRFPASESCASAINHIHFTRGPGDLEELQIRD